MREDVPAGAQPQLNTSGLERLAHGGGAGEALLALAGQGAPEDGVDLGRRSRRRHLRRAHTLERGQRPLGGKGAPAGPRRIEHRAGREEVGARVDGQALGLLGRDERKGATHPGRAVVELRARTGQPEIGQLHFALSRD